MRTSVDSAPIVYSTLDPRGLGSCLSKAYFGGRATYCELFSRSWTDVYRVVVGREYYAARVWRTGFHDYRQVEIGCAFLGSPGDHAITLARCLRLDRGDYVLALEAPEGTRFVAVFDWVEGKPIAHLTNETCCSLGVLLAEFHAIGVRYLASVPRSSSALFPDFALRSGPGQFHSLEIKLAHRPIDAHLISSGINRVRREMERVRCLALPRGLVHGDFHHRNVLRAQSGKFIPIDFDDIAVGPLVVDIASFAWCLAFLQEPRDRLSAFIGGYEQRRRLESSEAAELPWFIAERDCWNIMGWAANVDILGDPEGRFESVLEGASARFSRFGL